MPQHSPVSTAAAANDTRESAKQRRHSLLFLQQTGQLQPSGDASAGNSEALPPPPPQLPTAPRDKVKLIETGKIEVLRYEELRRRLAVGHVEGLQLAKPYVHLGDEDFERVFEILPHEFEALQAWKRIQLLKKVGLCVR